MYINKCFRKIKMEANRTLKGLATVRSLFWALFFIFFPLKVFNSFKQQLVYLNTSILNFIWEYFLYKKKKLWTYSASEACLSCTVGKNEKKTSPYYFNANYRTEMRLVPNIMDYILLQFDALKFLLGAPLHGGSLPNFFFSM